MRSGRGHDELRPLSVETEFTKTSGGSVLISFGETRVLCTALLESGVPPFLAGTGRGWLTAEYAMLPSSTGGRKRRDTLKPDGRATEIQRLIGRSLRHAVDLSKLGENTVFIDCDVLQADGGTRTAAITGGFIALALGVAKWLSEGRLSENPLIHQVAAVSAGVVDDEPLLDLCYREDSRAQVDMNFVMDETGAFIELQGTGEGRAFTQQEFSTLLAVGQVGIDKLMELQRSCLPSFF
ncbi:MAG: ribonuclease PH [Clostridia bacterium]|nr:ribonuclease PH [Clostridia bacterium]